MKWSIAIVSLVMTIAGYWFYLRDIFRGKTKPHAYTWLVWTILTGVAFAAQLQDKGGPGSYVTGLTALVCLIIFGLALSKGEKDITHSDKIYLAISIAAIVPWLVTKSPLLSVVLVTIIDFFGFLPTIRKSFHKPFEETASTYFISGIKFILAIIALENYTVVTWLYPASLVVANIAFAGMLMIRRKQLVTKV